MDTSEIKDKDFHRKCVPTTGPFCLKENKIFGNYQIIEMIGRGGMGVVYRAQETTSKRIVALKVLISSEVEQDNAEIERFLREAQAAASLDHPNIVKVHNMGHEGGYHYFTMDYIEGSTFQEFLLSDPPLRNCLKILAQIARALHHAHQHQIIHRDVKPGNILIDNEGTPYLSDFGLVKTLGSSSLTHSNALMGTPFYMSPEQINSDNKYDPRIDVYSLGVVLYQTVTGQLPFSGKTPMELYQNILKQAPVPPRKLLKRISPLLEKMVLKSLAKKKEQRYPDAMSVARDLEKYLNAKRISRKYQHTPKPYPS